MDSRPRCPHALALLALAALASSVPGQDALLSQLSDPRWMRRVEAIRTACTQPTDALRDRLIEIATRDAHHGVRRVAIESLGYFAGDAVGATLRAIDAPGTDDTHRASALVAFARRGDADALERLVAGVRAGGLRRRGAIRGLAIRPDPKAFEVLAAVFAEGRFDPLLSRSLPAAMLACDRRRALELLFDELADPTSAHAGPLVPVLRDHAGADVRTHAIALLDADAAEVRQSAIAILGACGGDEALGRLEHLLVSAPSLRVDCAAAIGEIGGPRAVHALLLFATDALPSVRAAVARGLGQIGRREAGSALIVALRAETELTPLLHQIRALGEVRDPRAVADLVRLLGDVRVLEQPPEISSIWGFPHNVQVRAVALWSLRTILDGQPPEPLDKIEAGFRRTLFAPADFERMKTWWREHAKDPRYHFE